MRVVVMHTYVGLHRCTAYDKYNDILLKKAVGTFK